MRLEDFWNYVRRAGPDECWPWLRRCKTSRGGYGVLELNGAPTKPVAAHRLAYELAIGPIPPGLFVLHRCDNPPCCNPAHLYAGTHTENMRDARERGRIRIPNKDLTHCQRGHEFTEDNTRIDRRGKRMCKTCHRASQRQWQAAHPYQRRTPADAIPWYQTAHCPRGHANTPANVYVSPRGLHVCRACKRERAARVGVQQ